MIKDRYIPAATPESKKDLKPKPVTRPKGKEAARTVRDMVAARGNYKTR